MTPEEFATYIPRARQHSGYWVGHCPGHDDQHESLSWKDGDKGLVLKCHAGCAIERIAAALHIEVNGFFRDSNAPVVAPSRRPGKVIATYPYHDAAGALLFEVVRYDPKTFRQRKPDGSGGWTWSIGDLARVVYRLPALLGAPRVWWPEGEKDVDRLMTLGLVATTSAGGADAFKPEYAAQVAQAGVREVIVLPDHDAPGQAYAQHVAAALTAAGVSTRILSLPGLSDKGDVSDFLNAGGTVDDLTRLADAAPVWAPQSGQVAPGLTIELVGDSYYASLGEGILEFAGLEEHRGDLFAMVTATNTATGATYWSKLNLAAGRARSELAKHLDERCPGGPWRILLDDGAAEVARRHMAGSPSVELIGPPPAVQTAWWVPGWVPMAAVSLLFGRGGAGKSITAVALALAALRRSSLGGSSGWAVRPMRSILYLDWEADEGAVWRRLDALCRADGIPIPPGFHYLRMARPLAQSVAMVTKEIRAHQPEAMVVDSWVPACGTDARSDADATTRIMAAIRTLGLTTLGIAHVTNAAAEGEAESRPFGSVFNTNLARSLIEATSTADGATLTVTYRHTKINDGQYQRSQCFVFTYSSDGIAVESGEPDIAKLSIPEQILASLALGKKTVTLIAEETGVSVPNVRTTLARMENHNTVLRLSPSSGGRGQETQWARVDRNRNIDA